MGRHYSVTAFVCIFGLMAAAAKADRLVTTPQEARHTSYLHGEQGMVTAESKGIFVWFAGSGGNRHYGIRSSMGPILELNLDAGYDAIAAENPMYWNREGTDDERRPFIERYATLDAQMEWFYSVLRHVVAERDRVDPTRRKKIYLGGRSMGSGLAAQALDEYLRGVPRAAVMAEVEVVYFSGLHGHTTEDLDEMMRLEYLEYLDLDRKHRDWAHRRDKAADKERFDAKNPEPAQLDPLVLPKGPVIYRRMGWAPASDVVVRRPETPAFHVPRVVGIIGMRDQYIAPWIARRTYQRFIDRHPQLPVRVVLADTAHDPSRGDKYADMYGTTYRDHNGEHRVSYRPLERLRPVIDLILDDSGRRPAVPGRWNGFLPNREMVQATPACLTYLSQAMEIPPAALHAFYSEFFSGT